MMAEDAPEAVAIPSAPDNPFLPLLSKGLYRASVAMNKSTSDEVFGATPFDDFFGEIEFVWFIAVFKK